MSDWTTLVSAEDLAAALGNDDLIVVDTRTSLTDRAASEHAYRQAHIPGARYADLDRDLSDHRKTTGGRHPWPDAADFTALSRRFKPLERATSAFVEVPAAERKGAVWLEPKLVCQVSFAERTRDGRLRHPSYKGLREDKPAREVRGDQPEDERLGHALPEVR